MIKILTSLALLSTLLHADDFLDKSIDVTFPEAIGKLQLVTKKGKDSPVTNYDDPRLGHSLLYESKDQTITLYIFDAGIKNIKDGVNDDSVKLYFESAKQDINLAAQRGYYKNVASKKLAPSFSKLCPNIFLGSKMTYKIQLEKGFDHVESYIFCRGIKGHIFKIRATGSVNTKLDDSVVTFLEQLTKIMNLKEEK